ncbi:hypothetical protein BRYFOR_05447 [Marvinbryantia formatexigens DSM 14469]|uniref:Uncharacterized protein n=1 Tax=Marvinbryantia formatexigens DSM 14469 TaxID=478749 RepID=C6LA04_9FIRM|nr:hypothetical protein BRYFOR_05447 [Marvinbryantia formatexigens DSM 14469]
MLETAMSSAAANDAALFLFFFLSNLLSLPALYSCLSDFHPGAFQTAPVAAAVLYAPSARREKGMKKGPLLQSSVSIPFSCFQV